MLSQNAEKRKKRLRLALHYTEECQRDTRRTRELGFSLTDSDYIYRGGRGGISADEAEKKNEKKLTQCNTLYSRIDEPGN